MQIRQFYKYGIFLLVILALAFLVSKFFVLPGALQSNDRFELASLGQNITPFQSYEVGWVVEIVETREQEWPGPPRAVIGEQALRVKLEKGKVVEVEYFESSNANPRQILKVGERVVVGVFLNNDNWTQYAVVDRYRLPQLGILVLVFTILVVALLGFKGFSSLVGLGISAAVLLFFIAPQILLGQNPALIIVSGAGFISIVSALFAHGFNRKGLAGALANFLTVLCVFGLAYGAGFLLSLFGTGSEEASVLQSATLGLVNARWVLITAVIIGTLGALDDVTASQTATVEQLKLAASSLSGRELFIRSMRVGREHVAALVNTLALVYAAASLPLILLLLLIPGQPVWVILNSESVTEEIAVILLGSLGVFLAVPISTLLAVWLLGNKARS